MLGCDSDSDSWLGGEGKGSFEGMRRDEGGIEREMSRDSQSIRHGLLALASTLRSVRRVGKRGYFLLPNQSYASFRIR